MGCLVCKASTPTADAHNSPQDFAACCASYEVLWFRNSANRRGGTHKKPAEGTPREKKHGSRHPEHGRVRPHEERRHAPTSAGQERLSDADDGDWDNCETVFNLDEVDATQPLQPPNDPAVDTHSSSVVDKAFQNSLMGSKTSIPGGAGGTEESLGFKAVRETSLLRIEKVKGCMFVNQYLVVKYLGRGACGKVFLCLNVHDSRLYAMKAVRKADLQTSRNQANKRNPMDDLKREIMIMKKMKHLNIVTLSEVIDDPTGSKLLLVMEYLEGGPVMTREALERCERLPETLVSKYFRDMVRALDYLHSQRVVHGDLKPENVLVSADGTVKLSDFGCSKVIVSGNEYLERCNGTPAFLAPEMMRPNSRYRGRPTDIYAMGACLYTLVFGRIPFTAPNLYQLFQVVQNEDVTFPENVPISESLKHLLIRLLTKVHLWPRLDGNGNLVCVQNPKERITLSEIRHHPWVTNNGRYPVPRWSDKSRSETRSDGPTGFHEIIRRLVALSKHEKTYHEGDYLFKQGDPGTFMLYIVSGECEVMLTCNLPRRPGRPQTSRKRGSADSGDPLMNSSDSASSVALTEEDRKARKVLVEASKKAYEFMRMQEKGENKMLVGYRGDGDIVGEMSLFTRESRRMATVRAMKKTVAKFLSKDDVMLYLARHPETRQHLRELVWKRESESVTVEGLFQLGNVHKALLSSYEQQVEGPQSAATMF